MKNLGLFDSTLYTTRDTELIHLVRKGVTTPTHGTCLFVSPDWGGGALAEKSNISLTDLQQFQTTRGECKRNGKSFYAAYVEPLIQLCNFYQTAVVVSQNLLDLALVLLPERTEVWVTANPSGVGEGAVSRFFLADYYPLMFVDADNSLENNRRLTKEFSRIKGYHSTMVRSLVRTPGNGFYRGVLCNQVWLSPLKNYRIQDMFIDHKKGGDEYWLGSCKPEGFADFPKYCYDEMFLYTAVLPFHSIFGYVDTIVKTKEESLDVWHDLEFQQYHNQTIHELHTRP